MHDGIGIDFLDALQNSVPQLLPRLHSDMAQERASHLAEEGLHDVQPGSVGRRKHVFEPIGFAGQESSGFLGDMRRVIVQH